MSASAVENLKVALEKETLVVSLGAKLRIAQLKQVRDWFERNEEILNSVENFCPPPGRCGMIQKNFVLHSEWPAAGDHPGVP